MTPRLFIFLFFAAFLGLVASKFDPHYGFSELAGFGADYHRPKVSALQSLPYYEKPDSTGYDGQFYAQIALDPTFADPLYDEAIDHPSYRARRILQPALSYAAGLGNPWIVLQIHSLLNVGCWLLCAWLLLRWIPINNFENLARWFCCLFSMGTLESVRYSLADLPALTLTLIAIAFLESARPKSALFANALAALSKETSLIQACLFLSSNEPDRPLAKRLGFCVVAFACALLPLAIWMFYVTQRFPITLNSHDNIVWPFSGIFQALVESFEKLGDEGFSDRYTLRLLAIGGLLFQGAYLFFRPQLDRPIWLMGIIYALLLVCLGDAVWRGYWAGCRIALPVTFAFNLLLSSKSKPFFWLAITLTNLSLIHGIVRWL